MDCKSCGNDHLENFCPECGEKAFNTKLLSAKHFAEETFEGLVHFDNKFFRTVKTLITMPGQLSLDYTEGRRVRYMKPIPFFLVVSLLFFFLTIGNIFSLALYNYVTYKPFTNYNTQGIVKDKLVQAKLSMTEYEQLFNEKMTANSKEFIFIFIPFYGLVFFLLFFWKKHFFVEHLVFATHFITFILLFSLAGAYLIGIPFYLINKTQYSEHFDQFYSLFTVICFGIYLIFAVHKFYRTNFFWTILTSASVAYTFFLFIQYYRMLLFFKIIWLS